MPTIFAVARLKLTVLEIRRLNLMGLLEIRATRFSDSRGFFSETWSRAAWRDAGITTDFVQDNQSLSKARGTLRGLHFQSPPSAQAKLVRVTRGSAFDVAVDIRSGSPTYRRWAAVTLSATEGNQLLIPEGFAHGFLTLEDNTEVQYKASTTYSPDHDGAIRFDDPAIGIDWPVLVTDLILSDRDRAAPVLADVDTGF